MYGRKGQKLARQSSASLKYPPSPAPNHRTNVIFTVNQKRNCQSPGSKKCRNNTLCFSDKGAVYAKGAGGMTLKKAFHNAHSCLSSNCNVLQTHKYNATTFNPFP